MAKERIYTTKDSGKRVDFESGMRRDTQEGKARYDLIYQPMLKRWAELMGRGAEKYGENNWQLANSEEELNRFKASAYRHFYQFINGEDDEDHGAAVLFNIAAVEYLKDKLSAKPEYGSVYTDTFTMEDGTTFSYRMRKAFNLAHMSFDRFKKWYTKKIK